MTLCNSVPLPCLLLVLWVLLVLPLLSLRDVRGLFSTPTLQLVRPLGESEVLFGSQIGQCPIILLPHDVAG